MPSEDKTINVANRASEVAQDRFWFLESMDQLSRAMQDTEDLEQLSHVLEAVLSIFGCDRAWLAYPSDADSRRWRTVAQRASPEVADTPSLDAETPSLDLDLPMDPELAEVFRLVEASEVAVRFGADGNPLSSVLAKRLGARSQMCLAVHPKIGRPYTFGLDQCESPRIWTRQEQELFEAAGKRRATLLTSLLLSRDLQESKARLEEAQRVAHVGYWDWNIETNVVVWSDETYRIFGVERGERSMDFETVRALVHPEDREALYSTVDVELEAGVHPVADFRIVTPGGEVRTVHAITSKLWSALPGDPGKGKSGKTNRLFGTVQDITELKRAEDARHTLSRDLQESRAWLEEAQRVSHLGYWVWDLDSNRVIWSEETSRIFGLAPQVGSMDITAVGEMFHPDDREAVFRIAEDAIRSGTRADCEHRLLLPNGEMRVVHSLGDVRKTSEGRTQMFGTTQDITDRKLAEQALRRSQFYLSEGERLAHMGSWASKDLGIRWSDDLDFYWSDEVYKIFGFDPKHGTPTLQQFLAAIHPQDRASLAETIKMMHEQRCNCDVTSRVVRPDGELRYVRCVGIPVVEDGVFQGFHGTTMDVTAQELLTQELRREQAYLTDAQSMAHIGSWAYNLVTRKLLHSSSENARLYCFDPSQGPIPAERFFDTQHAEDAPHVNAALERAVREGTDFYLDEYRIHHTDGSIRFLRAVGHRNASGEPGEYVGISMDITERKRAEEERERLRQLEAELAHINRVNMMGELAAALAHEIRQPIAASITSANACLRWVA